MDFMSSLANMSNVHEPTSYSYAKNDLIGLMLCNKGDAQKTLENNYSASR